MKGEVKGGHNAPRIISVDGRYTVEADMVVVRIAADTSTLPPISAEINNSHLLKDVKASLFTPSGPDSLGYIDVRFPLRKGDVITTNAPLLLYGKDNDPHSLPAYLHGFSITPSQPGEALTVPRGRIYYLQEVRLKEDGKDSLPGSWTLYVDGTPLITAPIKAFHPHIYPNLATDVIVKQSVALVPNGKFTDTIRGVFVLNVVKHDTD